MSVTFYVDNTRPDLTGTISVDGSPTVTGATVTFSAANSAGKKSVDAQTCTIVSIDDSADTIEWRYEIQSGDFDTVGLLYGWLTVTYADGDVQDVAEDADGNDLLIQVERTYG